MDISQNGRIIARFQNAKLNGLPGIGCYTLSIALEFNILGNSNIPWKLRGIQSRLEWGDENQRLIGNCPVEGAQPVTIPSMGSFTLRFRLALSPIQLEVIEQERYGSDLSLKLWFFAELFTEPFNEIESEAIVQDVNIKISQSEWMVVFRTLCHSFKLPKKGMVHEKQHRLRHGRSR